MLPEIEKLLQLQDQDRRIEQVESELAQVGPQRQAVRRRLEAAQERAEALRKRLQEAATRRKGLELEADRHREQADRYAQQQLETRDNKAYQALGREIETCKAKISELEDRQLELIEEEENLEKALREAKAELGKVEAETAQALAALDKREKALEAQRTQLQAERGALTQSVPGPLLSRYERLRAGRGGRVVVGVDRRVCGGCHMKLPAQVVLSTRAGREVISCPNCGRILFYASHMQIDAASAGEAAS